MKTYMCLFLVGKCRCIDLSVLGSRSLKLDPEIWPQNKWNVEMNII